MRPSILIRLLTGLTAESAVYPDYDGIEPEHLFVGILERPGEYESSFECLHESDVMIRILNRKRLDIHVKLKACGIMIPNGPRLVRNQLGKRIGKRGPIYINRQMPHRSTTAWQFGDKTKSLASGHQSAQWKTAHLFEAFNEMCSPEVKRASNQVGANGSGCSIPPLRLGCNGKPVMLDAAGNVVIFLDQFEAFFGCADVEFSAPLKKERYGRNLRLMGGTDESDDYKIASNGSEWIRLSRPLRMHNLEGSMRLLN